LLQSIPPGKKRKIKEESDNEDKDNKEQGFGEDLE